MQSGDNSEIDFGPRPVLKLRPFVRSYRYRSLALDRMVTAIVMSMTLAF